MSRTVLSVPDISCEHCEKTITGALTAQPGVRSVKVDIPQKQVTLDYDEGAISVDKISLLLDDEGYPVQASTPA